MKLLVTGGAGQVGRALVRVGPEEDVEVVALDRAALDITDPTALAAAVAHVRPDAIINAAAYTAVDRAESDAETAYRVNRDGAACVADAAANVRIPLVHLSTDYVFDGKKGAPYDPADPVSPLNVYGASKAAGEDAVRRSGAPAVILRTAWVFEGAGNNFVTKILRLARERPELTIVADQWGHPSPASAVARASIQAARRARDGVTGTYHFGGLPLTTWHGLATATIEAAQAMGAVPSVTLQPVPTDAFPTAAQRPKRVEFDMASTRVGLGIEPPAWADALPAIVRNEVS